MDTTSDRVGAAAVWVTVAAILVTLLGIYLAWPFAVAYMDNLTVRQQIKAKSKNCVYGENGVEGCVEEMITAIRRETGLQLGEQNIQITTKGKAIVARVNYRAVLNYPFTGNLFGSDKTRYKRYKWVLEHEIKFIM